MLRIGIIGLGDIAQKAYLPVITSRNVDISLCSRNKRVMEEISGKYRLPKCFDQVDALISSGIEAAFVHSATIAHEETVSTLLSNGVHVYVDKPITDNYAASKKLIDLALDKKLILRTGFNRRYAPAYSNLRNAENVSMLTLQKNRKAQPGHVRTFVFDDFIHVVDTLLYLFPYSETKLKIAGLMQQDLLYHVMIQLTTSDGRIATGTMNRDSGTTEDRLELFTPTGKWVVDDVADSYFYQDKKITKTNTDDWQSTLSKRGFEQIIDQFIHDVSTASVDHDYTLDLRTHEICEQIVSHFNT